MGKSKKRAEDKPYIQKNLESLAEFLVDIRKKKDGPHSRFAVIVDELGKVVKLLPREDRENIESFFGLITGLDHSKKVMKRTDAAFVDQCNRALRSIEKLYKLHYAYIYDVHMQAIVSKLLPKFNREGTQIPDLEVIKYLVAHLIILQNGPKMSFEENELEVDTDERQDEFVFDEYNAILGIYKKIISYPDNSISLKLIKDRFEMLDFEDDLTIRNTFFIQLQEPPKLPKFPKHPEILEEYRPKEILTVQTLGQVRTLKERVFTYGDWDVVSELIFGNKEVQAKFEEFLKAIDSIKRDWSRIKEFKTGQKELRTSTELRCMDVYTIGGLTFTDPYEIMFLYVERNCVMASVEK